MGVKVKIFHSELQRLVGNPDQVRLEGETVGECLRDLVRQYPESERLIFDADGRLLKPFYVFVNRESMFKADFDRPLTDKDELILVALAVAG
jgi:molybdopterin converting factor small subunit